MKSGHHVTAEKKMWHSLSYHHIAINSVNIVVL